MDSVPATIEALLHPGQASVERALADVRAGRAVWLSDGSRTELVLGVESLDVSLAQWLNASGSSFRLVLSVPRLRRLGIDQAVAGVIAFNALDSDVVQQLAMLPDMKVEHPVSQATAFDQAALELARLALVLPAVVMVSTDPASPALTHLLTVQADDVRAYRADKVRELRIVGRAPVPLEDAGTCEFVVFRGGEGLRDQVAIIVGNPDLTKPVSVRLHSACLTGDLFGSLKCDCGDQLRHTVQWMAKNEGGVLLYLDQEGRGNGIGNKIRAYRLQSEGFDTYDADEILGFELDQRRFDFAAEMLRLIGVDRVRILTNNPEKIAAMKRAGLDVVAEQRVNGRHTPENKNYLTSKRDRAGHFIDLDALVARASD